MSEAIYSISINLLHPLHLRVSKETPAAFIIYKKIKYLKSPIDKKILKEIQNIRSIE